jgi:RNA polymerase sigma-70 factor (ECF subfamily)
MLQLSPQKQKIFRLSRYEGLNHEEIATELRLSKSTVKNHLVDTLRHIKDYMNVLKHW